MNLKEKIKQYISINKQKNTYFNIKFHFLVEGIIFALFLCSAISLTLIDKSNYLITFLLFTLGFSFFGSITLFFETILGKKIPTFLKMKKMNLETQLNNSSNDLIKEFNKNYWIDMIKNDYDKIVNFNSDNDKVKNIQINFKKLCGEIIDNKFNHIQTSDLLNENWELYFQYLDEFEKQSKSETKINEILNPSSSKNTLLEQNKKFDLTSFM